MKPKNLRLKFSVNRKCFPMSYQKVSIEVCSVYYPIFLYPTATSSLIRFSAVKEVLLRIKSMSTEDAGTWECRATNNAGKYSVAKLVRVRVTQHPLAVEA